MIDNLSTAIIGGSGLHAIFESSTHKPLIPETPYGQPSAAITIGRLKETSIAFLARHGQPHRLAPHAIPYRANLYALKSLGCTRIIAINTVGGISPGMQQAEHLVVPSDVIDYTQGREHTFYDPTHSTDPDILNTYLPSPLEHIECTDLLSPTLRQQLIKSLHQCGFPHSATGTYGCTQGPRLESPAEIRRMAQDGCDIVGMTLMPEAALAKEIGIEYASLCLVVNPAAGCSDMPIAIEDLKRAMNTGMIKVTTVLDTLF